MNSKCYKVVFSEHLGILVAVGEHATSSGKAASGQGWRGEVAPPSVASLVSDGFVGALRLSVASVVLACLTYANVQAQTARPVVASSALPTGAVVNSGSASISANGAQMAITQTTDKASLNWQSFNVGTAASVNIAQPNASSVLLNRVVGNDPSQILGKVTANGQVILLNPNGILFGKDGSVTASAFTASTFGLSDADFMNGYLQYKRNGSTASVVNQGTIEATSGGYVALIGATVSNEGTIRARQGHVVLAAAESATFQNNVGAPSANATVSVPLNSKVRLELTPAAVNAAVSNSGVITTEGGQVLISAAALNDAVAQIGARVTHSGKIDTSAPQAGAVTLLADNGTIKVDGSITANSNETANDKPKAGGDIIIGRNPVSGVLAKSTDASGGTLESQGGFVETSGEYLKTDGIKVKANEWLLDPTDITIAASGASGDAYAANYTAGQDSTILASDINASLNAGTSVTIATSAAGAGSGTISITADISKTTGGDASLTLRAHNGIGIAGNSITSSAGKLHVVMNSDLGGSGVGPIIIFNTIINSNGGNVSIGGGTAGNGLGSAYGANGIPSGIWIKQTSIQSGSGNLTLTGTSHNSGNSAFGVLVENYSSIITTSGSVNITGTSQTSGMPGYGVNIVGGSRITTGSGNITVNGTGANSSAGNASGVQIGVVGGLTTTSGNISLTGISLGTGGNSNHGVDFVNGSVVAGSTGTVTITGTASAAGAASVGVNNARVSATGATVTITGTASSGGAGAYDITAGTINNPGGNITLTADTYDSSGSSVSAGTGTITLQNRTAGTLIDVGGADVLTGPIKTLGITTAELAGFSAGNIKIGSTTSGNLNISTAITTPNGNVTLQSGANVSGSSNIAIAGSSLTIDNATDGTLSGVISGNALIKAGTGTLILTGDNSYNGTTTIRAGALMVGDGGNTGTLGTGNVSNDALLIFNRSNAYTFDKNISGSGRLTQAGSGTTSLSGNNTYTDITAINGGTLKAASLTALSPYSALLLGNNARLDLAGNSNRIGSLTGGGIVTTNGSAATLTTGGDNRSTIFIGSLENGTTGVLSLIKEGTGTFTLSGANNYSGTTTINGGILQIGNGGPSGDLGLGNVSNNGLLIFDRSDDITISNTISGTGSLTQAGTGTTTLLGDNSYDSTTISGGTLQVGNGGTSGTLGRNGVVNNASLVFNRSNAISIDNDISGTGSLTKIGAGTATLAGANTYSGTTTISNGTLQVGSGGTTGTLGTGSVVNNTSLVFERAVDTSIANSISGTGNVSANITTNGGTAGNLTINSNSFSLTGGTVDLRADGNITLSTPMATTNTSSSAVKLVAGQALAAGVSTGGNVIVNGTGAITVGTGGQATLYSGSVAGTTGLSGMAASGSGKFRYNSDEITTNYTKDLDSKSASNNGVNVIYREAPMLTLKVNDASKTYDGLAFSGGSFNATPTSGTLQNGDSVAMVAGNATFAGTAQGKKNVADSGTTITASDTSGTNALGYAVSYTFGTLTINKKDVSLASIAAASKTYDGNSTANITSGSITTGVGTETLSVSGTGTFNNADAADGKTVTVTDVTALTKANGTGAWSNYNLTTTGALTTTANISKKDVSLASIAAASKTYDGNSTANITSGSITTGVGTETLSVSGSGNFSDKNAADGKTVTVTDVTGLIKVNGTGLGGGDWANYNLTTTGAMTTTANIAKASLSVTAIPVTKTYDGTTSATGTATVGTLASTNDSINNAGIQTFLNKDVGTGKTVTASGVTIKDTSNADMTGNYVITYVPNTSSEIKKASLLVTANADARFVTQTDAAGYKGVTYSGLVGGETSDVLGGSLSISRTNALTDVAAGSYSGVLVPAGLTSSNYDIRYTAGNYTIAPADRLLVDTTNQTVTYGTTPTYTTTAKYLDSRDNLIKVLTQTGTNNNYTFNDGAGTTISLALKPYSGSNVAAQSTSGNTAVGSYEVKDLAYSQTGTNFNGIPVFIGSVTINPKAITPSTSVASKVYDGTTSMNNVVVGMSGQVGNDLVSISGTGAFTQKNVGTNLGYTVTGISLSSADAGNYYLSGGVNQLSGINGVITPASLVLSTENISKIYDGTVDASGILKAVQGTRLFGTDTMRGGTFTFSSPEVGLYNKVVRVSGAIINDGNEGRNYSVSYMDNTQSSIISSVAPFVPPMWNTTDTVFQGTGGRPNKILYEITMERNSIRSIQENSEICKPLLSIDCFCISPGNRDLDDGVNCSRNPRSVQIKYTKIPQS